MMKRYFLGADGGGTPAPSGTLLSSVININEGSNYVTQQSFITGGAAGATVTIKVTNYFSGGGTGYYFNVNGVAKILNDTFTVTLDASGNGSYITITNAGSHPNVFGVTLTITAVSAGTIGSPSTRSYSHTS